MWRPTRTQRPALLDQCFSARTSIDANDQVRALLSWILFANGGDILELASDLGRLAARALGNLS
jgi:hypothetical protein